MLCTSFHFAAKYKASIDAYCVITHICASFCCCDRPILVLFLLAGRLVQFSLDSNIAEEECHKLLDEFMPRHIRTRKITQRLFIK